MHKTHACLRKTLALVSALVIFLPAGGHAAPSGSAEAPPSLVITSAPLPDSVRQKIYSTPVKTREISPADISGRGYFQSTDTLVTRKVAELSGELARIQNKFSTLSSTLSDLQQSNQRQAADYYANVATINTQLQSGTTPGNPRLVKRLKEAETQLETLGGAVSQLNALAVEGANIASEASFLLEETRAAYTLSGAVEEDHVKLAQVEDNINNTVVLIDRLLNTVSDDITRTSTYMSSERNNIRALSLSVTNGDLYGKSLKNSPFSNAPAFASTEHTAAAPRDGMTPMPQEGTQHPDTAPLSGPRPLAKIRFDRPNVDYEQPVYMAMNEALQRYPNARFDLVAVHPANGNAAEVAIESTKARRNAEKVLRTLTQMGLPMDRIDLSYNEDPQATANEVHIFVK